MALGNRHSAGTIWLPTGNPDTTNISTTDFFSMGGQPGDLGLAFEAGNPARSYQRVQLDSGCTAATPAGTVLAGDLLYWKDKSVYLVTNDSRFAMNGASAVGAFRNYAAGICRLAATAGNIIDICQRGQNIPCADGGNSFTAGETVFPENDTSASAVDRTGVGTYPGVLVIGIARGAAANGFVNVDIDIPYAQ